MCAAFLGCFAFYYVFIMLIVVPAYIIIRRDVLKELTDTTSRCVFDKWEKRLLTKKRYSLVYLLIPIAIPLIRGCLLGNWLVNEILES